jgi:hypothetical protein
MPERFEGHDGRECGEHRTLGGRAWCYDCSEYCYPSQPCSGCELPSLRAEVERLREIVHDYGQALAYIETVEHVALARDAARRTLEPATSRKGAETNG